MPDPLEKSIFLEKFSEVRELVRTVELSAGDTSYRLEIFKHVTNPKTPFVVDYFVKHQIPKPNAQLKGETLDVYLLDTSLPWVAERSPDAALATALGFIGDGHPKPTKKTAWVLPKCAFLRRADVPLPVSRL